MRKIVMDPKAANAVRTERKVTTVSSMFLDVEFDFCILFNVSSLHFESLWTMLTTSCHNDLHHVR